MKVTFCLDPSVQGKDKNQFPVELSDNDRASPPSPSEDCPIRPTKSHKKYSITPEILNQTKSPFDAPAKELRDNKIALATTEVPQDAQTIPAQTDALEQPIFGRLLAKLQLLVVLLSQNILRKSK